MSRLVVLLLALVSWNALADASDQTLLQACRSCHAMQQSDPEGIGPSLVGIVGRSAGTLPGYTYSSALAEADFIWDIGTLRVWIQHSEGMRPGTFMRYNNVLTPAEIDRLLNLLNPSDAKPNEPRP